MVQFWDQIWLRHCLHNSWLIAAAAFGLTSQIFAFGNEFGTPMKLL